MSLKNKSLKDKIIVTILSIILFVIIFGLSYFCTAGVFWLICKCFNWTFSWKIAAGIWLILFLLGSTVKSNITVKK